KGLCCLSQTSIRGHFRDYITSVQLLLFHAFPFWLSGCISMWLFALSFCVLHNQCPAPSLPCLPFLVEWLYFHVALSLILYVSTHGFERTRAEDERLVVH